ncbi:MAG TPA: hypothetical protein VFU02_02090 [Polyangiaceae bacterium]|nr:hypothetical protein [Polyangiaceae bacterium]
MESVEVALGHPYRKKPATRMPATGARTRKLVAHGVSIVLVCLVCRWLALMFSSGAVIAAEVFLVVGTWLFTLRCQQDNRAARGFGWALRIVASIDSAIVISNALRFTSFEELHLQLSMGVAPTIALLFLAARLHSFGLPHVTRKLVTVMAACLGSVLFAMAGALVTVYLSVLFMITAFSLYLSLWFWGCALMVQMWRISWVEAHEWWLDVEALPRVEWTSYARLGDGRIELASAAGKTRWFDSSADAISWLDRAGFCPWDYALAEGLVDQPPERVAFRDRQFRRSYSQKLR